MRVMRLVIVLFGLMVAVTGGVLAVGHRQSADGLWKIVFTANTAQGWRYVEILPTGKVIVHPTTLNGNLLWSPNNAWVIFSASSGMSEALYLARPDGGERRVLLEGVSNVFGLTWSPDSEWIYYTNEISPDNYDLFRLRIADRHVEAFGFSGSVSCCRWSSDGEWLVVRQVGDNGEQNIVRLRADRSARYTVLSTNEDISNISTPFFAGDWIVFVAEHEREDDQIFRIRPDGSDLGLVGGAETSGRTDLSISADGEWVAFVEFLIDRRPSQLVRTAVDGGRRDVLVEGENLVEVGDLNKVWSPDGKWMLFYTRPSMFELNQVEVRSGEIERVYSLEFSDFVSPHYLPVEVGEWSGWWWLVISGGVMVVGLAFTMRRGNIGLHAQSETATIYEQLY